MSIVTDGIAAVGYPDLTISDPETREPPNRKGTTDTVDSSTKSSQSAARTALGIIDDEDGDHDDPVSILDEAVRLVDEDERLLAAARLIVQVEKRDPSLLNERHRAILKIANECNADFEDLVGDPNEHVVGENGDASGTYDWKRQGESHGKHDIDIYYKIDEGSRLTCRIESPIEQSLLVPLLAVLNEVDLYPDWIPHYSTPLKLGIQESEMLERQGRASQIVRVLSYVPWPFCPREVMLQVTGIDEIDYGSFVGIRMHTITSEDANCVPPASSSVQRVDFDGAFLFRACPSSSTDEHGKPRILVSFKMFVDAHMRGVPQRLINFVTRTVIGRMWLKLLRVAEHVRDGTSEKICHHRQRIEDNAEFYSWVEARIQLLLEKVQEEAEQGRNKPSEEG